VLSISESIIAVIKDKDGKLKETRVIKEEPQPKKAIEPSIKSETKYEFADWSGVEDVIMLCEKYIKELEKVVVDGTSGGFISG
jgi:hypothetical protein